MKISIIIPGLNEGEFIGKTLERLLSLPGNFEIIVVDGGSVDNTREIVQKFGSVLLIKSEKGRAIQMNKGAKIARGEVLLFLHADTLLPSNAYNSVITHLLNEKNIGGSFYLRFDKEHLLLNLYSWCSKLSMEFFTYGDHAIFMRTKIFEKIGGYKNITFMEDIEIQKRLRRTGRFKKLKTAVITSARRFEKTGITRQFLIDILLIGAFKFGVSPIRLKRFYKDHYGD